MNSDHNLVPAPRHGRVNGHNTQGVALTYGVSGELRRGQIYILWAIFGVIVFYKSLFSMAASTTLRVLREDSTNFIEKLVQGNNLVYTITPLLFGRLADAYSRHLSLILALLFFIVGCIIPAASPSSGAFAFGTVLHTIGMSGMGLLAALFIADYTPLKWRGAALSWTYLPSLVMVWAGTPFSFAMTWRWIYGMTAILVFVLCAPTVYLLFSAAHRHITATPSLPPTKFRDLPARLDLFGLLIFALGDGLIEFSSTTYVIRWGSTSKRHSSGQIAMLVIGLLLIFPVFIYWELYRASYPLMPRRILRRKGILFPIMVASLFSFTDAFPSGSVGYLLDSNMDISASAYLFYASAIAYGASAPLLGVAYYVTRRYKPFLVMGNFLFLVGCVLWLIAERYWDRTTYDSVYVSKAYIFTTQALIGVGGVAINLSALIGSQASVAHADLAIATALFFTWTWIAGGLGTGVSIAISSRPDSDRMGATISLGLALGLSLLCLFLSLFVPNIVLGDKQNAAEAEDQTNQDAGDAIYATTSTYSK